MLFDLIVLTIALAAIGLDPFAASTLIALLCVVSIHTVATGVALYLLLAYSIEKYTAANAATVQQHRVM